MIKQFIVLLIAGCMFFKTHMQASGTSVTIEVTNLKNNKGHVLISLYDDKESFPDNAEKAAGKGKAAIKGGVATITFRNLKPGRYAVAVLHDENENLKMDFNLVGMPKEGYGFSNNAKGMLGPPSFAKAAFAVNNEEEKVKIRISYFLN